MVLSSTWLEFDRFTGGNPIPAWRKLHSLVYMGEPPDLKDILKLNLNAH